MKVLVIHTFYQQKGGEDVVFRDETNLLAESIAVRQLCFNNSGSFLNVIAKLLLSPWNVLSALKFKKHLKDERPDLIHIHNWHFAASPLIIRIAKRKGIPVVHTLHNYRLLCPSVTLFYKGQIYLHSLKGGFPWKAIKDGVYRNSQWQTFWLAFTIRFHQLIGTWQSVDRFITLTDQSKIIFQKSDFKLSPEQIVVKPNFVYDKGFNLDQREAYFVFVGRLTEDKGISFLLETFARISYPLVIIGSGPEEEKVRKYAKDYPHIKYLGQQPKEVVLETMKQASALLFPSLWYEGMPMTLLEALSCATPVIASRLGAMETIIEDGYNGFHFQPGNSKDLQDLLERWQSFTEKEKKAFRVNARKTYEQYYTPEINKKQLLDIYRSVLAKKKLTPLADLQF